MDQNIQEESQEPTLKIPPLEKNKEVTNDCNNIQPPTLGKSKTFQMNSPKITEDNTQLENTSVSSIPNNQIPKTIQNTPTYKYNKKSVPSPIYNYFDTSQKYFESLQKGDDNLMNNTNFPLKSTGGEPLQGKMKMSPGINYQQTPNYNECKNIFNPQQTPNTDQNQDSIDDNLDQLVMNYQKQMNNNTNPEDYLHYFNNEKNSNMMFNINNRNGNSRLLYGNNSDNFNISQNKLNQFNQYNPSLFYQQPQPQMLGNNNQNSYLNRNHLDSFSQFPPENFAQSQIGLQKINLNPELYLFEKFGKRGWQCEKCNNFNFEQRIKCNKCGLQMMPKLINRIQRNNFNGFIDEKKKKPLIERKGDWSCPKCRNLNFAFRTNCNRCQLSKNEADLIKNFTMMNGNEHHPQIMSPNDYEYQKFLNPNQINIYNTYYNLHNNGNHNGFNMNKQNPMNLPINNNDSNNKMLNYINQYQQNQMSNFNFQKFEKPYLNLTNNNVPIRNIPTQMEMNNANNFRDEEVPYAEEDEEDENELIDDHF